MIINNQLGIYIRPRGFGSNWIKCFKCGLPREDNNSIYYEKSRCQTDISSYVRSRNDGLEILAMFAKRNVLVVLDDRIDSAKGVQIKIGTCREHYPILEKLFELIKSYDNHINEKIIDEVLNDNNL